MLATFGEQFASLGVQLGARYDGSPIIAGSETPPVDDPIVYRPTSAPGGRAPHVWLDAGHGAGASLFDRLGAGFTLLRFGQRIDASELIAAAARASIPLAVVDVGSADARELYERDLVLVRPDQHVAWRGNAAPSDPDRLLAQVVGRRA